MQSKSIPGEVTKSVNLASVIKSARDIMRKDKGLNGELDRLPQLTWLMFLKFLDDAERIREQESIVAGKLYSPIISAPYRWRDWASDPAGLTGAELISFVNNDESVLPNGKRGSGLLAYLRSLQSENGRDSRDVVSNVFRGVSNRMLNGYLLRDVVNKIGTINFSSSKEIHDLSFLYESLLKEMRDAAGDSGEFYTPRPVIKFMVQMTDPRLDETILDPAAGTGGFLVESFLHLQSQCKTTEDFETLQLRSLYGIEAKSLPYLLCQMNLLLHGVEYPNIDPLNALRFPLNEISEKDRVDVIMTNPPFGGEEERGIQSNFPEDKRTNETALLFLQLIMRKLKNSGRCAMVVPDGLLFGDNVAARIKKMLLEDFNLHTIVRLPNGVFNPYTAIRTNLLFFDKGKPTTQIWYFEHPLPQEYKTYSKTKPIRIEEFDLEKEWWDRRNDPKFSRYCWKITIDEIVARHYNLDTKNPNNLDETKDLSSKEIIDVLEKSMTENIGVLEEMKKVL